MSKLASVVETSQSAYMLSKALLKRRLHSRVPVIGITGSAGKTTTKELCAAVLGEFGECVSTHKSKNVWRSTAKLVMRFTKSTRYCVAEMGVMRPGALDLSLRIAKPDIGVFTIVARDHYSAFRSLEAIAEEKSKLIKALPRSGTAIINIDDPLVRQAGEQAPCRVITIGRDDAADIRLISAQSEWPEPLTLTVSVFGREHHVRTTLNGEHLAVNVLATLGVACALELPIERVVEILAKADEAEGRMQTVVGDDGVTFLRDDFKSPHWSFSAPLQVMRTAGAKRKVVVVGTVSDSPDSPSKRYKRIAREVREIADLAVFVGRDAEKSLKARLTPDDTSIQAFTSIREASAYLKQELQSGDLVLLKGTNKQDHLVRLILDRSRPISCWRENCEIEGFCAPCRHLYETMPEHAVSNVDSGIKPAFAPASAEMAHVIAGLGNPGEKYVNTAHNAGHAFLEHLARESGAGWTQHEHGEVCEVRLERERVLLLKPASYMNASGLPIRDFLLTVGGHPQLLTVVHDEIDLQLGDVRLKRGGGDAGHKGIRSVITELGTEDFARLRVGVRAADDIRKARKVVLERLEDAQIDVLQTSFREGSELLQAELQRSSLRTASDEGDSNSA